MRATKAKQRGQQLQGGKGVVKEGLRGGAYISSETRKGGAPPLPQRTGRTHAAICFRLQAGCVLHVQGQSMSGRRDGAGPGLGQPLWDILLLGPEIPIH